MSISSVVNHFLSKGVECSIINQFSGKESASKIACNTKILLFRVKNSDILIVTSEKMIVSNKKFKDYFKANPKELNSSEITAITGHPMGGVSPFGLKNPLKVYIDISLKGENYIYLCAGLKNFVVTVTSKEIVDLTSGEWIDICESEEYNYPPRKN